ncbi:hypothetical protein I7I51_06480 [Histoplasma capsulatum]|uniref:Uncharacterized protein n=1 Tax=Ajellomyces capsulatus TaxID=5037 RepID=A0A8A1MLU5_AJECA|nr:hypothetical protein I7I51_06480 [Histoplasma capsulatum]
MIEERETEGTERGHIKIKSKKELFTETDEVKLETRNIRERASHGFPSRLEMGSVTGSKLNESRNIESTPREGSCMKVLPKEKTSGNHHRRQVPVADPDDRIWKRNKQREKAKRKDVKSLALKVESMGIQQTTCNLKVNK